MLVITTHIIHLTTIIKSVVSKDVVRAAIIVAGIALMTVGILHGELTAIMRKAIVICLECIGIG